jgi:hypothetical protein
MGDMHAEKAAAAAAMQDRWLPRVTEGADRGLSRTQRGAVVPRDPRALRTGYRGLVGALLVDEAIAPSIITNRLPDRSER